MGDEFDQRVGRIRQDVAALRGLATDIEALVPRQARAGDATGCIEVMLGTDGLPAAARVGPDWRRQIGLERFAGAVAEACQAARQERLAAWTRALESSDLPDRIERIGEVIGQDVESLGATTDRWGAPAPADGQHNRLPPLPARLVLDAADAIGELEPGPAASRRGSGSAAAGKLTVEIDPTGTLRCEADLDWVARQEPDALADALGRAFTAARADLAANAPRTHPALAELMSMVTEPWR